MDLRLTIVALVALVLLVDVATADLFFNRSLPNSGELRGLHLKCLPGRTIIKVTERQEGVGEVEDDSDEFTRSKHNYRRMYHGSDLDERCHMCICSADGQNEVCIKRPTGSVNECILIDQLMKKAEIGEPYEHEKSLPFRIRRDLMWHNDEIPYDPMAKCYRGHSYYTNHETPNDTNINFDDDVTSLLDFKSQTSCFFCVCSVSGNDAGCISRNLWFCNYLRYLRNDKSGRDMYANMFQQDRPAYFRQLSWRLRRTMDNSMFDLMEQVGGVKTVEGQKDIKTCVPFVSEYSDCTAENECAGCTKCGCSAAGQWECQPVHRCDAFETDKIDEELLDAAIDKLDYEKKMQSENMHEFYTGMYDSGKKSKSDKYVDIVGKKKKSKPITTIVEKKNKHHSPIGTKKENITDSSTSTDETKVKLNVSMSTIENKDISNETPGTLIKAVKSNISISTLGKKENSNESIDTVDIKVNSIKSISTIEKKGNSSESTGTSAEKDSSKESITTTGKPDNSSKSLRLGRFNSIGNKDKAKHIELKSQKLKQRVAANRYVPVPPSRKQDESEELLEIMNNYKPVNKIRELSMRPKRSTGVKNTENKHNKRSTDKTVKNRHPRNSNSNNNTVKFYSTVDELNEDTLKHSNLTGTLHAKRVELNTLPDISRRSNTIENSNKSLHIDFNQPKEFNHITDNKIDVLEQDYKIDLNHEKLNSLLGNHTQKVKDKTLSKLVVNELNKGTEIIGDNRAPVTSNITFTSENDTLTAMAFIAGNLLNKLWNMEKDASGLSLETEDMKYEKISDLLDLFKEPLNLRQEAFLKNALEKLSSVIDKDKDIKNVTICQTLEDAEKLIDNFNSTDEEETSTLTVHEKTPCKNNDTSTGSKNNKTNHIATIRAISKINDVLGLMRKFESIQKNLSLLKNESEFHFKNGDNTTKPVKKEMITNNVLTKDEASSFNVFGNILNKITKLLLPKSSDKKLANTIKNKNAFSNQNVKNNFMKMHNIDLSNMTMTAKDKLILDYISHINSNPDCILHKRQQNIDTKSLPSIEGNILLNLSEFFKMKSFADLIHLIQPEKDIIKKNIPTAFVTTKKPVGPTMTTTVKSTDIPSVADKSKKFASTKEKLKSHLKSIIEDLLELQNGKGIITKSNIRIADALPCIYRIMNAGKDLPIKNNEQSSSADKIVDIFNLLKNDMKEAQTRRSDSIMKVRPKSAVVLERVVKKFVDKSKVQTRRFAEVINSKPTDELKKIMDRIRNISSTYKNQALYNEVPAAEKLVLLKALSEDVRTYVIALEGIKQKYKNVNRLSADQYKELAAFVDYSATNISLNEKVIKKVEKLDLRQHVVNEVDNANHIFEDIPKKTLSRLGGNPNNDDMKISRNQIINHLIGNRMKIYIKLKEAKDLDLSNDMNYNIAKRVLFYLDSGNYNLAHELFKMLVMQKHEKLGNSASNDRPEDFIVPTPRMLDITSHQDTLPRLLPMMQMEESTTPSNQMKWMSQDHLIKQLLNIKNMGL